MSYFHSRAQCKTEPVSGCIYGGCRRTGNGKESEDIMAEKAENQKNLFNGFIYGGDYNPEQWLDRPDIQKQDLKLMKKAHINTVTLGVFS